VSARVNAGGKSARTAAGARRASAPARSVAPFAPLVFAKRDEKQPADRIVLFEVDGVEYTVPAVIPTGDALRHLAIVNQMPSEAMRGMYLLQNLVGSAGFDALLGQAEMTDGDWHKLIDILSEHCFGRLEGASGN